jgi:hypothetical protein
MLGGDVFAGEEGRAITVYVDQAKVVGLPKAVGKVVLGNPIIVGVTEVPGAPAIVLTGKAFGATNLVVLDDQGSIILDTAVNVALPKGGDVVVQRAGQRSTYRCGGNCELRMQLGDSGEIAQDAATQITTRNGLAVPGKEPASPSAGKAGGAL